MVAWTMKRVDNVPSEKIDELLGAGCGSDNVREGKGLEDLVCDAFAATHLGNCFGC